MTPSKEVAADDPMEIVGVVLDRPMDLQGLDDMARTFVEEYTLMGWQPSRIMAMFRRPFYAGAHDAYEALGEDRIVELIEQTCGPMEGSDG